MPEQILIALSAGTSGFKKGQRVVVRVGTRQWHLGRVKSAGAKVKIEFDDGYTATVEPDDFKDVYPALADAPETHDVLTTKAAKAFLLGKAATEVAQKPEKAAKGAALKRLVPNR